VRTRGCQLELELGDMDGGMVGLAVSMVRLGEEALESPASLGRRCQAD
jgi:hypothetical protein